MDRFDQQVQDGVTRFTRGLIARGVVGIAFAVVLLVWPEITLHALVLVFGAYSVIDGAVALYAAATPGPTARRWWLIVHGLAGIAVGVATLLWTGLTALTLLYLIGAWAIALGTIEIGEAVAAPLAAADRVTLGLDGLLRIAFGVIMWWRPGAGALALITLVAAFALVTGAALIAVAIQVRLRRHERRTAPGTTSARALG